MTFAKSGALFPRRVRTRSVISCPMIKCRSQWPPTTLPVQDDPTVLSSVELFFLKCLVQSLSRVRLFVTPWTAVQQASLSITNTWGLLKLTSIESVMPSNHLLLCWPMLATFPPAFNLSQHQGLFQGVNSLHQVAKVLEFQLQCQSFQ